MKSIVLTLVVATLLPLHSISFAQGSPELDAINMKAYLALKDGNQAMTDNDLRNAKKFYSVAYNSYQDLKQRAPEYKTTIVDIRLKDLKEKLDTLEKRVPTTSNANTPEDGGDYRQLYLQVKEEALALGNRLFQMEKANLELEGTVKDREGLIDDQRQELLTIRQQLRQLDSGTSSELASLEKQVEGLKKFNELLKTQNQQYEADTKQLEADLAEARSGASRENAELQNLRGDLADILDQRDQLQEELEGQRVLSRNVMREQALMIEALKREATAAQNAAKQAEEEANLARLTAVEAEAQLKIMINRAVAAETTLAKQPQASFVNSTNSTTELAEAQELIVQQAESFNELSQALEEARATIRKQEADLRLAQKTIAELETRSPGTQSDQTIQVEELQAQLAANQATLAEERAAMNLAMKEMVHDMNAMTALRAEVQRLRDQVAAADTGNLPADMQTKLQNQQKLITRISREAELHKTELQKALERQEILDELLEKQDKEIVELTAQNTDLNLRLGTLKSAAP